MDEYASEEDLKLFTASMEQQVNAASTFAMSSSPFATANSPLTGSSPNTTAAPLLSSTSLAFDPASLEKELQLTGQQLADSIRQLQADIQLAANMDNKRAIEAEEALQAKLAELEAYTEDRIEAVNEQVSRVSKQALGSIASFIGILAVTFIAYTLNQQ
jgi:hypothetical protein